ncbi:unnamed protein product [Rotaria sp. Silwood1]|nr:unnamed protein product [Rotaria sp. Silwood1]CAF1069198.1 unnamed protein product [Rotaria sp. Silwood1]CAF3420830.1 unnamed protein product [Rotaria sp. Silwood1]CAF4636644.1 unnamed protein product [Rotaria sp. Silwood1]
MDNPSKNQASGSDDRFLGESMLRRITNFGLERNPNQTKHWMPDSAGKECYDCQEKFTPFRRRHHCRICGLLFCNRCCSYEPQAKLAGYSESNIRLCSYCSSTLLKLPKPNSMSSTTTPTSSSSSSSNQQYLLSIAQIDQEQQQQLQTYSQDINASDNAFNADHFSLSKSSSDPLLLHVVNEQTSNSTEQNLTNSEISQKNSQQQSQQRTNTNFNLKSLFNEIFRTSQGLQMQKQRYRLRTIECVPGKDIVDWLIKNQRASILSEAKLLCQCFINELYLEPVALPQTSFIEFKPDQTLYKLGKRGLERDLPIESSLFRSGSTASTTSNESNSIDIFQQKLAKTTGVVIGTDLNYVQFNAQVANTPQEDTISINSKKEGSDFNMPTDGNEQVDEIDGYSTMKQSSPSDSISSLYNEYEELLLKQILIQFYVDQEWFPIILNICRTLPKIVRVTSINNDSTPNNDIRRNVKFKKLPGGLKTETEIINGCVFTKNVIHRSMPSKIDQPRVLLLKSQIEYQRSDDHRLTTLEPVLNQEQHYLYSCVDKINSHFKPDILVVEKTVSRLAQDFIISNGLVLIYNVKESIMQRLSKCLCTTIMTSIDSRLPSNIQTPLGHCEYFQIKEYELNNSYKKRLMFFAGCPPEYGCTVLIRGGTLQQLKVVKSIMRLFLLITYSTQLEQAYLNDCYGQITNNYNDYLLLIKQFDLEQYIDKIVTNKQSIIDLITNGLLLSTSPYVKYNIPYILKCTNQQYVPSELLYQNIYNNKYQQKRENNNNSIDEDKQIKDTNTYSWFYNSPYNNEIIHVHDKHKFIKDNTILPGIDQNSKAVYAHYRASGGRCQFRRRRWYDWLTLYQQQQPRDQPLETIFAPYLDLRLHLQIAILYSAHCTVQNKLLNCRQPEILEMPAYSIQDTTLGSFLEQHCFSTNDAPCKTCQQPLQDHVRQIVHGEMKLVIRIKHVDKTTSNLQKLSKSNGIYMWSYCEHCRESSAKRLMSADTWSLSFTKFLELLFHLESFSVSSTRPCQHHLFRDHYHYFHSQQFIASFRLFKIKLKEFYLPKSNLILKPFVYERDYYIELTKSLSVNGYNIFSTIVERLIEFKNLTLIPDSFISKIDQYLAQERLEQQTFRSLMDEIQLKMTAGNGGEQKRQLDASSYVIIDDQIVEAKKFITKIVHNWNTTLNELVQIIKKYEKQQREASKKVSIKALPSGESTNETINSIQNESDITSIAESLSISSTQQSTIVDNDENNIENGPKIISSNDDEPSKRSGVLKFFSTFLATSETDFMPLKSPFNDDEHLQLSGKYTVNHRELSSIIAHALSMSEYEQRLNEEILLINETNQEQKSNDIQQQNDDNDNNSLLEDHQHIELHFHDSSTKFVVKIFYAAKFHLLRQIIFSNNDQTSYIRSLSHCKKWQPRGGKSKSEFWQTNDDYFVLKDLNQKESSSFSTFAPSYIDYMTDSIKYNHPTTLTKILGIYHIQYRHNSTGENFKRDILVLENLLNNQNSTIPPIIYDLKGSMRNRLVVVDDTQTNAVLLDENFLTQTQENPFYVRLHTKWTLMKALYTDTQFLAKHGIVDYSLLLSCHNNNNNNNANTNTNNDDEQQSIVFVGIIDYIRTYTWDKKIETIVKSMSSVGQSPTVISPEHYRTRFLRRMDQYFPVVPDEWHAYEKKYLDISAFPTETMTANLTNNDLPNQ